MTKDQWLAYIWCGYRYRIASRSFSHIW